MRAESRILRFTGAIVLVGVLLAGAATIVAVLRPEAFLAGEIATPPGRLEVAQLIDLETARLAARNSARETGFKIAAGLGALAAALLTWGRLDLSRAERRLAEVAHFSERYAKAVEHLGHVALDVQIGGIYALEQLGLESPEHRRVAVEVICAFIRQHGGSVEGRQPATVQAALTVLSRHRDEWSDLLYDLSAADLSAANLFGANLTNANLFEANLAKANLIKADLSNANLTRADLTEVVGHNLNLSGANLFEAVLANAALGHADLRLANLFQTNFTNAQLYKADLSMTVFLETILSGTNLFQANLTGADLRWIGDTSDAKLKEANLLRADLTGTNLHGADLAGARVEGALYDETTTWPNGFAPG